jgi:hypothetical protein
MILMSRRYVMMACSMDKRPISTVAEPVLHAKQARDASALETAPQAYVQVVLVYPLLV